MSSANHIIKTMTMSPADRDCTAITSQGAFIRITPSGNVSVYASNEAQIQPAPPTQKNVASLGNAFSWHGVKVELTEDNKIVIYTNGTVEQNAALELTGGYYGEVPSSQNALPVGATMPDGTIYVGFSFDTGLPMFAAPADAPTNMTYQEAVVYARSLEIGGKKGFHIPSEHDWGVIAGHLKKGQLQASFNLAGSYYWSSTKTCSDVVRGVDPNNNDRRYNLNVYKEYSVRCVRE